MIAAVFSGITISESKPTFIETLSFYKEGISFSFLFPDYPYVSIGTCYFNIQFL